MPLAAELAGVSFGYRPGQHVLEDVDLRLGEGEFVAVAGPNGGGRHLSPSVTAVPSLRRAEATDKETAPARPTGNPAYQGWAYTS